MSSHLTAGEPGALLGHDQALQAVRHLASAGRLAHAFLVTGPDGVGKTSFALAVAADVVCLSPAKDGQRCRQCRSCELSDSGTHPDILRVAPPKEETTIGQMRELRYLANLAPNLGPRRVVIVERAETLNEQAANAILKVLEDAPAHLLLLLLAPSLKSVLATVRSRSIEIPLKAVARAKLQALLEERGSGGAEAARIADYAAGAPGRAIRLLASPDLVAILGDLHAWTEAALSSDISSALRLACDVGALAARARKHLPGEEGASERQALAWVLDALMAELQSLLDARLPEGWTSADIGQAIESANRARWLVLAYAQADLQLEQMVMKLLSRRKAAARM